MATFQAIICHRSFVEIKMLGLRYVAEGLLLKRVWKEKPRKVTTSGRKRRSMRKIESDVNLTWSGWPIANGSIAMRATTSWHAKLCLHIFMNIQENKILHLNCINLFSSSKKWFGPVKVLLLLDQNVQWSPWYLWNDCYRSYVQKYFIVVSIMDLWSI